MTAPFPTQSTHNPARLFKRGKGRPGRRGVLPVPQRLYERARQVFYVPSRWPQQSVLRKRTLSIEISQRVIKQNIARFKYVNCHEPVFHLVPYPDYKT